MPDYDISNTIGAFRVASDGPPTEVLHENAPH